MRPLIADFYDRVRQSALARLFHGDWAETERNQFDFQAMFWGGEDRYTPRRGHPRLRARHLPFPIGQAEADAWMSCMEAAVAASAMPQAVRPLFLAQVRRTAQAMINRA